MPNTPVDTPTKAQCDAQYSAQYEMDQDGPIDWALDVPIPFRPSADHERGGQIDDVDARGMIP